MLAFFLLLVVTCYGVKCEPLCDNSSDVRECVRAVFSEHALCEGIIEADDDPVYVRGRLVGYMPVVNASIYLRDTYFYGLDTQTDIEEFYIDDESGNLVMSVRLRNATLDSTNAVILINQKGKAPKEVGPVRAYGTHDVILTAIIHSKDVMTKREISRARVSAYFPNEYAKTFDLRTVRYEDNIFNSTDPVIAEFASGVLSNLITIIKELFLTGASYFFRAYMENQICKFGFPLDEVLT